MIDEFYDLKKQVLINNFKNFLYIKYNLNCKLIVALTDYIYFSKDIKLNYEFQLEIKNIEDNNNYINYLLKTI